MTSGLRIGIDLGGTKIAGVGLNRDGAVAASERIPTPRMDYTATLETIAGVVERIEAATGRAGSVGIGTPGSISPKSGLVQNANSVWLNGQPLQQDLETRLDRPVRLANDANCFALSEATDGAARDAATVFGVILGTGCGGGIVIDGKCLVGPRAIGGEWGHTPLPWCTDKEHPGPECWCGQFGCIETWVSGPGLANNHRAETGETLSAEIISARALAEEPQALASLMRHTNRLARALAMVVNIIDPDVIVLGGGLSNLGHLYDQLPGEIEPYIFADHADICVLPALHGDSSGVRGAAWLWDEA